MKLKKIISEEVQRVQKFILEGDDIAKVLFASKTFHRLVNETVAAVRDKNGALIVGTQVPVTPGQQGAVPAKPTSTTTQTPAPVPAAATTTPQTPAPGTQAPGTAMMPTSTNTQTPQGTIAPSNQKPAPSEEENEEIHEAFTPEVQELEDAWENLFGPGSIDGIEKATDKQIEKFEYKYGPGSYKFLLKNQYGPQVKNKEIHEEATWKEKLQDNYCSFEEFEDYDEIYGLSGRLGYENALEAWNDNPTIHGSTNPGDYGIEQQEEKRVRGTYPFEQGKNAHEDGVKKSQNPYGDTDKGDEWIRGWEEAWKNIKGKRGLNEWLDPDWYQRDPNNVSQEKVTWEQMSYIAQDYTSIYNTAIQMFRQELHHGILSRYLVERIASAVGIPRFNTSENIYALTEFFNEKPDNVFIGEFDNQYLLIFFGFKIQNFNGWNVDCKGAIKYKINGERCGSELQAKVSKVPKIEEPMDSTLSAFKKVTDIKTKLTPPKGGKVVPDWRLGK